jgi:predicted cation transporter
VLGLLISGGILIPGNIPNIIAAYALHIKSTEWAKLGVPLGLVIMTFSAVLLLLRLI